MTKLRKILVASLVWGLLCAQGSASTGNNAKGKCVDLESSACYTSDSCHGVKCELSGIQCAKRGHAGTCQVVIQKPFNCCCACVPSGPDFSALSGVGAAVLGAVLLGVGLLVQRQGDGA